jgi:Polysaccharide biosynthesis/export protein
MKSAPRDRIVNKTSRLLPVLIALVVPFEVAAKEPTAPPSVSCLDPEGERYLQGLLDRIHQLETQLDAEVEAHLTERAEAERKLQSVSNELAQHAAAALDPPKQPTRVEGFDPEQVKKELATLKAALDEATAARRRAETEAAAAAQTAVTFANALKDVESRLDVAEKKISSEGVARVETDEGTEATIAATPRPPELERRLEVAPPSPTKEPVSLSESERPAPRPIAEPRADVQVAEPVPTMTPAAVSEAELAAAQLAALSGKRAALAGSDKPPAATAPVPRPSPNVPVAAPIPAASPAPVPESERAAAQLAALTGKPPVPSANPSPIPVAPKPIETTNPSTSAALGKIESPPAHTRCDEPVETVRIAPGDRLAIHVDHLKEVSDTVEVGSDGRVHLPLVGTVPAAGRNQHEFAVDLTQRLTVYLQAPRVDVALKRDCGR